VTRHFFTVDVEEYFHANALDPFVQRETWKTLPDRLTYAVPLLLEELARAGATGTFFVLGWVAKHRPDVVREIAAAGHEIASHGFWHQRVTTLSYDAFFQDISAAKSALENLVGTRVHGYRAPSFSIVPGCEWAFDALLEAGYSYDSSLFPIRRRSYGYPSAPRVAHDITRTGGTLRELPLATTRIAGVTVPAAGGGYLRHFPLWVIRRAFLEADARGEPATFYIHPWEIDAGQPRFRVGTVTRFRHYRGLSGTLDRLRDMLARFRFTAIAPQGALRTSMPDRLVPA
jgi:polysaccharide deacetylase family protein (PEP-CTERM system associated)